MSAASAPLFTSLIPTLPDALGIVGVACVVWAYWQLQRGRWHARMACYPALNGLGSLLILISVLYSWNLASFVIQIIWLVISGYGLWSITRRGT